MPVFDFDPNATDAVTRAFDAAWVKVQEGAVFSDPDSVRETLAKRVLLLARRGETDERRLTWAAVSYLRSP